MDQRIRLNAVFLKLRQILVILYIIVVTSGILTVFSLDTL